MTLSVTVADDHTFRYEPGQHTAVPFELDGEDEQSYTAANLPGTDQLVLAIERYEDGNGSQGLRKPEYSGGIAPVRAKYFLKERATL